MSVQLALQAQGMHKRYGRTEVLRDTSLALQRGEVKVIVGPSGSGKSTLLRCLALLEDIDDGEIYLAGELVGKRGHHRERERVKHRVDIGMVFQQFNLFPHLTAAQNVAIGPIEVHGEPKGQASERANQLLDRVGLSDRTQAYPNELSGGQQQRVAIARALIMDPKVMLFDEPTSALDAELTHEVLEVMEELADAGMTMLAVTHELSFAKRAADTVMMMDEGYVLEEAPPQVFFGQPSNERTRTFLRHIE